MTDYHVELWDPKNPIDLGIINIIEGEDLYEKTIQRAINLFGSESALVTHFVTHYKTVWGAIFPLNSARNIVKYAAEWHVVKEKNND